MGEAIARMKKSSTFASEITNELMTNESFTLRK